MPISHDDEERTNPGRIHPVADFAEEPVADFAEEDETEGTEEVTQVDSLSDRVKSDHHTPADADVNPFAGLDDDTMIPD